MQDLDNTNLLFIFAVQLFFFLWTVLEAELEAKATQWALSVCVVILGVPLEMKHIT